MPLYEYECQGCERRFSHFQSVQDRDVLVKCECGGAKRRVKFGHVHVAEIPGTMNGPYARKVQDRIEQNRIKKKQTDKSLARIEREGLAER